MLLFWLCAPAGKDMDSPLVSVVIATYNRSNVLPYSIGSVLQQTYSNFEVLVVGDGCTDDSPQVVEDIGDSRIRWIGLAESSGHQSTPNNTGLTHAKGELVAYLGHDDLWFPHHLQVSVDALRDGADVAYGLSVLVDEDERTTFIYPVVLPYESGTWIPPSSIVHRRAIIDAIGGWKDYRTLDCDPEVDLWRRMQHAGYRFQLVPRLSVVKIPAAWRRDIYVTRQCHEQRVWLERLGSDPTLEVRQLALCYVNLRRLERNERGRAPYMRLLTFFASDTLLRARRTLRELLSRKQRGVDRAKRRKGLKVTP